MVVNETYPLIGLAGTFASGKDTLANYLVAEYNYYQESGGDLIRGLSMKRHGSMERPQVRETAQYYRTTYGPQVFIDMQLKNFETHKAVKSGLVINGLRALGEAKTLKKMGAMIVFVDAPVELRYERMKSRSRDKETEITLDEFKTREQTEWYAGNRDVDFNLRDIKKMADIVLENRSDLEGFLREAVAKLKLSKRLV